MGNVHESFSELARPSVPVHPFHIFPEGNYKQHETLSKSCNGTPELSSEHEPNSLIQCIQVKSIT